MNQFEGIVFMSQIDQFFTLIFVVDQMDVILSLWIVVVRKLIRQKLPEHVRLFTFFFGDDVCNSWMDYCLPFGFLDFLFGNFRVFGSHRSLFPIIEDCTPKVSTRTLIT